MREQMLNTINKFGLIVKEIEPSVFKVTNTEKEIDIHRLKQELGLNVAIFRTSTLKLRRVGNRVESLECIYYILPKDDILISKYDRIVNNEYDKVVLDYKTSTTGLPSIDTIYTSEELGRIL